MSSARMALFCSWIVIDPGGYLVRSAVGVPSPVGGSIKRGSAPRRRDRTRQHDAVECRGWLPALERHAHRCRSVQPVRLDVSDIDYFYTSRLQGEPLDGVEGASGNATLLAAQGDRRIEAGRPSRRKRAGRNGRSEQQHAGGRVGERIERPHAVHQRVHDAA